MEALTGDDKQLLRTAIEKRRKHEAFERSLGRAMRAAGFDYDAYIQLVGIVRDESRRKKVTLEQAAIDLSDEQE
jgi:hypothetical protein